MFGLFASQEKKTRENAANWLELADKVWNYRRDALTLDEAAELEGRRGQLRRLLAERADAARLKLGIEALEGILRRTGGAIYPKTSLVENVEFLLVAVIVILGVRTYFVQPFKIPTNSMWPSYYGMTGENLPADGPEPGVAQRLFGLLAFGAERIEVVAPRSGEVVAPFFTRNHELAYTIRNGRTWLIFPAQFREYTLYVDGVPATLRVPYDFDGVDGLFRRRFASDPVQWAEQYRKAGGEGDFAQDTFQRLSESSDEMMEVRKVPLGKFVRAGDALMRFSLLTGDQLFVDRMRYHFVRPSVGQGFVFRTVNIPGIGQDQYFVKRLIGGPGDRIEIRQPALYRNGSPIAGSKAFALNANRVAPYRGYFNASRDDGRFTQLFKGEVVAVPKNRYLALGDNSRDSLDGRYWGFVPAKDVVGTPLFIYYPFSPRWGTPR